VQYVPTIDPGSERAADDGCVSVIGREAERDAIGSWVDADRPGLLRIEGVAGIGKSTLWSWAVGLSAARGDRVMAWRASVAERDIAFAVLTALLDVPMVSAILAGLAGPRRRALDVALGRIDPGQRPPEPGLVGLAVADVFRLLTADRPLLVAIDDVQWMDRASEDALAFGLRRLADEPVGLVVARRTGLAPDPAVDGNRDSGARLVSALDVRHRVDVDALTVGALGRLLHERLGTALPRPLLVRVHTACGGNPFLALETGRSLLARNAQPGPGEPFPVPPEVGPLVRDHLATLTPSARRAVVLVAMSPDPRLDLIGRAVGARGDRAIDEACRKGVLVVEGDLLRPAHPLFASTAYADAPPGERRTLRRVLARLVDDPVERAIHLAATVAARDDGVAEALAGAGRLAQGRGAPGVAAELLERAARAARDPAREASLLVEAGEAAAGAGDPDRGAAALRAALDLATEGRVRANALVALGEIVYVKQPAEALPLLVSALDHTEDDPVLEATVHSYIAGMADMDPAQAIRSAELAAAILERPDVDPDPDHLACALLERAFHCLLRGEPAATTDLERGLRMRTATAAGNAFVARRAQEVAERCLFHYGRLAEARELDEAEYRRLRERGEFGLLPPMAQTLSVLTQLAGDWPAARRYADECLDLVSQGAEAWRERAMLAVGRIHAWDGDLDAARNVAIPALRRQEAAGDRWEAVIFCAMLGFVELSVPDGATALGYLTRALDHADAIEVRLPTQFRFLCDLVEAAVLAGDLDLAENVLAERLEAAAERQPLPWTVAMAHRGRGLLATARGDLPFALRQLDHAIAVYDTSLAMPFERGRTLYARGQAHRRAGHRRAARLDLDHAAAVFAELGARAWRALAELEVGRLGGRAPTGSTLTTSERRVAERAAAGRTNKEIAAELMISTRTVESQLSVAYRKLTVRSRGQLAAALRVEPQLEGKEP
jgi:DNA-binding CsgD family transcriptional regulator